MPLLHCHGCGPGTLDCYRRSQGLLLSNALLTILFLPFVQLRFDPERQVDHGDRWAAEAECRAPDAAPSVSAISSK